MCLQFRPSGHHVGCWPTGETGQWGPKTSCLHQVLNTFPVTPSFRVIAMKDFPFMVGKPSSCCLCLKQLRCGIKVGEGPHHGNRTHDTHLGERRQQPGEWVRWTVVSFYPGAGEQAVGSLPIVFIQHQNTKSKRKMLSASAEALCHQAWGVLKPLAAASNGEGGRAPL